MAYRIAIVDDDPALLETIRRIVEAEVKKSGCICCVDCYADAIELDDSVYDAYLLDISMPQMDGIYAAARIRKSGNMCSIIFISSHETRVFEALRVEPLRFVRKRYLNEELREAVSAMCGHLQRSSRTITVSVGDQPFCVPLHKILYIESCDKLRTIVLPDGKYEVRTTMHELESELLQYGFFRIHRGYLVNLGAVYTINNTDVRLNNGAVLPISRKQVAEAKKKLKRRMFG